MCMQGKLLWEGQPGIATYVDRQCIQFYFFPWTSTELLQRDFGTWRSPSLFLHSAACSHWPICCFGIIGQRLDTLLGWCITRLQGRVWRWCAWISQLAWLFSLFISTIFRDTSFLLWSHCGVWLLCRGLAQLCCSISIIVN
jgi:hypothetical protein